ncbi:MAG: hypothetical protein AB7V32_05225 [Candidatus Berkiella sp.]
MPKTVPVNWNDYESQYKAGLKFLIEKVQPDVNKILDQQYRDTPAPKQIPEDVLTLAFDTALENKLKNDQSFVAEFKQVLESVNNMLRQWNIPRGDMSPEMRNSQTLGKDPGPVPKNFAIPEWAKGLFDDAAYDPKIRQAVEESEGAGLSADSRVENKLQNRYTPNLQMKMDKLKEELRRTYKLEAPQYVPKNRMTPT